MTITFLPSPYHTAGRQGALLDSIVVHWMAGTLAATDAEFDHGSRRVSAHYGIEDGMVHQYAHDYDTAWHAGNWDENLRSIGIEHSAQPGRDATPATIATSVALMVELCRKYGISPDRIFPHSKFFPTQCPGTLPLADMVARVRAALAGPAAPVPPVTRPPASGRNVAMTVAVQKACHVTPDGMWGNGTQSAAVAVIRRDTANIRALQGWVGTRQDGAWGPLSEAARIATVRKIQSAIGVSADGAWGPISSRVWATAVAANLNKY